MRRSLRLALITAFFLLKSSNGGRGRDQLGFLLFAQAAVAPGVPARVTRAV
jgi:hypothetical protein